MISERDLLEAIMETEDEPPSYTSIKKLANLYIVYDHLYGKKPIPDNIETKKDSEFWQAVNGKDMNNVLAIMDELMETLEVINNRAYQSVIQKIRKI